MRQRILLLTFLIAVLIGGYFYIVLPTCVTRIENCVSVKSGPPTTPAVYRVLQPTLEHLIAPRVTRADDEIMLVDMALQALIVALTIPALFMWLKRWADDDRALMGTVLFSFVYLLSYHFTYMVLSTSLEILFVVIALVVIKRPHVMLLAILTIFASLNRETGIIIPSIYIAYHLTQWRVLRFRMMSLLLVGLWVGVTIGLRLMIGSYPHMLGTLAGGTLAYNLANLPDALFTNILLVPLVLAVLLGYRAAPAPIQRLLSVAGVWFVAMLIGSAWNEFHRLVLPLLPLIIPLIFSSRVSDTLPTSPNFQQRSPSP